VSRERKKAVVDSRAWILATAARVTQTLTLLNAHWTETVCPLAHHHQPINQLTTNTSLTMAMADRRRINGPTSATAPPVFLEQALQVPSRRAPDELRKICNPPAPPRARVTDISPLQSSRPLSRLRRQAPPSSSSARPAHSSSQRRYTDRDLCRRRPGSRRTRASPPNSSSRPSRQREIGAAMCVTRWNGI
jgi:hypothetical protein